MFEISTLRFVKNEFLTHTVNFIIGFAFSQGSGSTFSQGPVSGPGPLYKVCPISVVPVPPPAVNPNNFNKEVVFNNCVPFTHYIRKINNTKINNAKDIYRFKIMENYCKN